MFTEFASIIFRVDFDVFEDVLKFAVFLKRKYTVLLTLNYISMLSRL